MQEYNKTAGGKTKRQMAEKMFGIKRYQEVVFKR